MSEKLKVPENLEEAMEVLKTMEGLAEFRKVEEKDICLYHHTVGRWIRNNWGLWAEEDNKLKAYFKSLGLWHADDMSSIILTSLWRQLNNKPLNIQAQVRHFLDYWKNEGVEAPISRAQATEEQKPL